MQGGAAETGRVRLHKVLAASGVASRRACEELIRQGRVTVEGRTVTEMGLKVDPRRERITLDGRPLARPSSPVYILLHKPRGYLTSRADRQGRPLVISLLPAHLPRLFPVGRLDFTSEGLLLLTNDGAVAHRLLHPRFGVTRIYHVKVRGHPVVATRERLRRGVRVGGEDLRVTGVRVLKKLQASAWLTIALQEGRHRQIHRMCEAVGHPVSKLIRIAFGPLHLGSLPRGQWRHLTAEERDQIRRLGTTNTP